MYVVILYRQDGLVVYGPFSDGTAARAWCARDMCRSDTSDEWYHEGTGAVARVMRMSAVRDR